MVSADLYVNAGKFPTLVTHQESLESKVNEIKATVKFQLKKVLCMGVAVGNCDMEDKQIFQNVQMSVNFLVSLLKKNWQNVSLFFLNLLRLLSSTVDCFLNLFYVFCCKSGEVAAPKEYHGYSSPPLLS
jgi:large subunit ribosomal protein L10Ae